MCTTDFVDLKLHSLNNPKMLAFELPEQSLLKRRMTDKVHSFLSLPIDSKNIGTNCPSIFFPFIENGKKVLAAFNLGAKELHTVGNFRNYNKDCKSVFVDDQVICLGQAHSPKNRNPYGQLKVFDLKKSQKKKFWTAVGPMMGPRSQYNTLMLDEHIYVVGGDSDKVERLSLAPLLNKRGNWGEWETVSTRSSLQRTGFGLSVTSNSIYMLGGKTQDTHNLSYISSSVSFLDISNMKWTRAPHLLECRKDFAVATLGGKIYVLGGTTLNTEKEEIALNSVEIFDTRTRCWKYLPSMTKPRSNFSAVTHDDYLFAVGGDCKNPGESPTTIERFSLKTQLWEIWSELPCTGIYEGAIIGNF